MLVTFNTLANLISVFYGILILLLIIPFPVSLRKRINSYLTKIFGPTMIVFGILMIVVIQEFIEQAKANNQRKLSGNTNNLHFFASTYFNHQRNMYIALISVACVSIFLILERLTRIFIRDHNCLLDQLSIVQRCENSQQREQQPESSN